MLQSTYNHSKSFYSCIRSFFLSLVKFGRPGAPKMEVCPLTASHRLRKEAPVERLLQNPQCYSFRVSRLPIHHPSRSSKTSQTSQTSHLCNSCVSASPPPRLSLLRASQHHLLKLLSFPTFSWPHSLLCLLIHIALVSLSLLATKLRTNGKPITLLERPLCILS